MIIDELPYLISDSPELPSILQKFVDRESKEAKMLLVLSGKILLGECKWFPEEISRVKIHSLLDGIKQKRIPPIQRNPLTQCSYVLFLPEKPIKLDLPKDCRVIDAQEVIACLR